MSNVETWMKQKWLRATLVLLICLRTQKREQSYRGSGQHAKVDFHRRNEFQKVFQILIILIESEQECSLNLYGFHSRGAPAC